MAYKPAWIHARKVSAAFIAMGHISLFVLAITDHLAYTVPSEFKFLLLLANNSLWLLIHLICASVIILALWRNKNHIQAMSLSAGFMGAWGLLNLLGGISAIRPVSLAGPVLGLVLAGVAYSVAMSWAQSAPHRKGE